jgi:hypothetical protein
MAVSPTSKLPTSTPNGKGPGKMPPRANKDRRRHYRQSFWRKNLWTIVLALILLLVGGAFVLVMLGSGQSGKLSASASSFDFGQVKINNGPITTRFQLSSDSPGLVTKVGTT